MNIEYKLSEDAKAYYPDTLLPATAGSAGIDLIACKRILNGSLKDPIYLVHTGLHIHINDPNYVAIVVPRSSAQVRLINTIGIIDSDYQGEILLKCHVQRNINLGDRIAQLLILPVIHPILTAVDAFSTTTQRGDHGFGSTGN
jgi:dUTP pyrophosphatase